MEKIINSVHTMFSAGAKSLNFIYLFIYSQQAGLFFNSRGETQETTKQTEPDSDLMMNPKQIVRAIVYI